MEIGGKDFSLTGPYNGVSPGNVGIVLPSKHTIATLPTASQWLEGTMAYTTDGGWYYIHNGNWLAWSSGGGGNTPYNTLPAGATPQMTDVLPLFQTVAGSNVQSTVASVGAVITAAVTATANTALTNAGTAQTSATAAQSSATTAIANAATAQAGVNNLNLLVVPEVTTWPALVAANAPNLYPSYTAVTTDPSGNQQTSTSNGTVWSQPMSMGTYSYLDCVASPSMSDRYFIGIKGQEPSVLIYNGYYNLFYTNGNANIAYSYCAVTADPRVAANWSTPVVAIGGGTGGESSTIAHSYAVLSGTTIWVYGYEVVSKNVVCFSAATTTATVPTFTAGANNPLITGVPGGGSSGGNLCVTVATTGASGAGVYVHYEALHGTSNPGEGSTNSWQTTVYYSATLGGALTSLLSGAILSTLRIGPNASASQGDIKIVGTTAVMFFHGGGWGRCFPNDIYRATMPVANLGTDGWTIEHAYPASHTGTNGYDINPTFLRRAHFFEFDQVADAFAFTSPNGIIYMMYSGCNNRSPANYVQMITALVPMNKTIDGPIPVNQFEARYPVNQYFNMAYPSAYQNYPPPMVSGMSNIPVLSATVTGTWANVYTAGAPNGVIRTNTSAAATDDIRYDCPLLPGTYALNIGLQTGPANGVFNIIIHDGVSNGVTAKTFDCYAASIGYTNFNTTFVIYGTEAFQWRIRIYAPTKNASSSAYTIGECGITVQRTGN